MRKYLLFSTLALLTLVFFANKYQLVSNAQTHPEYRLEVTSENAASLPSEAQSAILLALNQRWTGPTPIDEVFFLPSMRIESGWILADLYYNDTALPSSDFVDTPLSNSFMMVLAQDNSNNWISALVDEPQAADLARHIPDSELDFNAKTTLFKYFPSQFKTSTTDVDYKFPWSSSGTQFFFSGYRTTNTIPCSNNSAWHGVKNFVGNLSCHALDFAPVLSETIKTANVVSPVSGYVSGLCKNPGDLKQAAITIKASNSEEYIGLYHIDKASIPSNIQLGSKINQGDPLGQLVEGFVNEKKSTCPLVSEGTHLHLVAPEKPFNIDGYTFTEDHTVLYKGVSYTMKEYQNKILSSSNGAASCTPPSVGDWVITNTCNITSSMQINEGIIVNSGAELILNENVSVDMNLMDHNILIKDGGKLLIKTGSRIL